MIATGLLTGCGDAGFSTKTSGKATTVQYKAEPSYDDTPKTIVPESGYTTITVTGTAQYQRRRFDSSVGSNGALISTLDTYAIPCAEFNVYDSSGTIVQAGSTNTDGTFSYQLSSKPATYTMVVRSRALNNCLKVSVLSDINSNLPYGVEKTVTVAGSTISGLSLVASGSESVSTLIEGGAFNILNQIYKANKYMRDKGILAAGASADKVSVYWQAGFTPYAYYGYPTSPISFYEPGQSKLYICGGIQGDVKSSDTDHFDDSVILHEYGHFLEDRYSKSDSPGGSHNGDFLIDPRLAWSEGWANFLQSAIKNHFSDTDKDYYTDTYGYKETAGDVSGFGVGVRFKLHADLSLGANSTIKDKPNYAGEGTFRELGVARTLYKSILTSYESSKSGGNIPFGSIWKAFTAFNDSTAYLTNFALFAANLKSQMTTDGLWASRSTNIGAIYDEEMQPTSTSEYGALLSQSASTCAASMSTATNSYYGSEWRSNQLRSNDFYVIYYNPSSPTTIELEKTSSDSVDLDLYIYSRDYTYQETSSTKSNSSLLKTSATRSATAKETISLSGLSAGYYVVNVKAYTESAVYSGGTATYQLRNTQAASGGYLCPTNQTIR